MLKLEQLERGLQIRCLHTQQTVTLIEVEWNGPDAVTVYYRRADGQLGSQLLFRDNEAELETVHAERLWAFDVDGGLLRLARGAIASLLGICFNPSLRAI